MHTTHLSNDQKEALVALLRWRAMKSTASIRLAGLAGTGKTTLLAIFRHYLHKHFPKTSVAFASLTGKASQVLRVTLGHHQAVYPQDSVSTLHSLLYRPVIEGRVVVRWMKKEELQTDLILVDEASMVDETLMRDVMSFGIPVIWAGDQGQLPPIGSLMSMMEGAELVLTEIHRQARDNPIIKVAWEARTEGRIEVGRYGNSVEKLDSQDYETGQVVGDWLSSWNRDALVLTGFNHSRIKLNQQIRNLLGFEGQAPVPGDRLVCLRNNWNKGIVNGMMADVRRIRPKDKHSWLVELTLEDGSLYEGSILREQFNTAEKILTKDREVDLFDFGYAMTVHKAQGSQAPKVLVFEERSQYMDDDAWSRWLYTAVTRAQESLLVVGK